MYHLHSYLLFQVWFHRIRPLLPVEDRRGLPESASTEAPSAKATTTEAITPAPKPIKTIEAPMPAAQAAEARVVATNCWCSRWCRYEAAVKRRQRVVQETLIGR